MLGASPAVEVLLPVHNEAESIESTVREIYEVLSPRVAVRFIICEDGSVDDTKQVLLHLSQLFPIKLLMSGERKGYSRAVIDGMKSLEAEYLLCLDSDGQCDPKDFGKFWDVRDRQDVAIGWRVNRSDNFLRKVLSRTFYHVYQLLYRVPVHDPSCPFVLAHKQVIESVVSELGEMKQGFWWEFMARVHRRGFSIREIPVNHRGRSAGKTQVYRLSRMPAIGYQHFVALFKIWLQTRKKI
ncbi:MAG: glycosyltransferase family 2 protein [Terriglobia bacterium]|jgi:dolichol-phosphate mannosyltransferase